jgi:hypothetical protein
LIAAKYLDKNAATLAACGWPAATGPIATAVAPGDDAGGVGDVVTCVAGPDDAEVDGVSDAGELTTGDEAAVCAGAVPRCC